METGADQRAERMKQQAVKQTIEEAANQKVLQHYAKTVHFNDDWVSLLSKMSGLVGLMSYLEVQRMRESSGGVTFTAGFEVLTVVIGVSTLLFIQRWVHPLLAFKVAFVLSLLQGFWFATSYSSRMMDLPRLAGDLSSGQFPFGLIYFIVCWASDRYMMRSQDIAKQTADDLRAVLKSKDA